MNLIALLNRARRMPLDERYAYLLTAKKHFKPRSIDCGHLEREISHVLYKRLRRDSRVSNRVPETKKGNAEAA